MNLRIFHHRHTRAELWKSRLEAFLVGSAIILFWRGVWNLADQFLFPSSVYHLALSDMFTFTLSGQVLSSVASLVIGVGILILSKNFVNQFIDDAVEEAEEFE